MHAASGKSVISIVRVLDSSVAYSDCECFQGSEVEFDASPLRIYQSIIHPYTIKGENSELKLDESALAQVSGSCDTYDTTLTDWILTASNLDLFSLAPSSLPQYSSAW